MIAHCLPSYLLLEVWVQMLETLLWVLAITNSCCEYFYTSLCVDIHIFFGFVLLILTRGYFFPLVLRVEGREG